MHINANLHSPDGIRTVAIEADAAPEYLLDRHGPYPHGGEGGGLYKRSDNRGNYVLIDGDEALASGAFVLPEPPPADHTADADHAELLEADRLRNEPAKDKVAG